MGLDITHYKATNDIAEVQTLFNIGLNIYDSTGAETKEHFKDFNVDFNHFKNYIQDIIVPVEIDDLFIINNKENFKKIKSQLQLEDNQLLVKENDEQLIKALDEFEIQKSYKVAKKNFQDINGPEWIRRRYYSEEKREGFYFKEVGFQRKGMNNNFWNQFCNGENYNFGLKENFEYALSCLDKKSDNNRIGNYKEQKENFVKNFIENFEHGASFMSVSY